MITLNLISPEKKQELRLTQLYLVIKNLIILVLLLTIMIGIVLLVTKAILQNYFNDVINETTLTTKYASIFNKELKEFNKQIRSVESIQKNYISWPNFFIDFAKLIPTDVKINDFTINNNKILITGDAKTREKLLEFKGNLEKSNLLSNVAIPLENLLKKVDVVFNVKADINLDKIKNYEN
ncbi:MAG: PilN domain-containing protein [Patescibacteria group bacterium]|jgi:hypothetical protein